MAITLFVVICIMLMIGFPVALTLAGTALLFAGIGTLTGSFDPKTSSINKNHSLTGKSQKSN